MRVFSAVQPTGAPHIGNYIGFLKNAVELQKGYDCIYSIVDLHALTVPRDPEVLRADILKVAALYTACGLDPKKSILFVQSDVSAHAELCWILNTLTKLGELKLMHQFKEKSGSQKEGVNIGLLDYPVLMAADILLYKTDIVPIGEDQKQHVELSREIARRFNARYDTVFTVPRAQLAKSGARIMSLDNPNKKMSKSASSGQGYISLLDSPDVVCKKIARAVTDSGTDIVMRADKPALSNLLTIYYALSGTPVKELEKNYQGKGYKEFKSDLAKCINVFLAPIQQRYIDALSHPQHLRIMLRDGATRAAAIANPVMEKVKKAVGIGTAI